MTWLTTWPDSGVQYAEHATEALAEVHAAALVRRGVAHAVVFWRPDPHRTGATGPRTAEQGAMAPGADRAPDRPAGGISEQEGGKGA